MMEYFILFFENIDLYLVWGIIVFSLTASDVWLKESHGHKGVTITLITCVVAIVLWPYVLFLLIAGRLRK